MTDDKNKTLLYKSFYPNSNPFNPDLKSEIDVINQYYQAWHDKIKEIFTTSFITNLQNKEMSDDEKQIFEMMYTNDSTNKNRNEKLIQIFTTFFIRLAIDNAVIYQKNILTDLNYFSKLDTKLQKLLAASYLFEKLECNPFKDNNWDFKDNTPDLSRDIKDLIKEEDLQYSFKLILNYIIVNLKLFRLNLNNIDLAPILKEPVSKWVNQNFLQTLIEPNSKYLLEFCDYWKKIDDHTNFKVVNNNNLKELQSLIELLKSYEALPTDSLRNIANNQLNLPNVNPTSSNPKEVSDILEFLMNSTVKDILVRPPLFMETTSQSYKDLFKDIIKRLKDLLKVSILKKL